MLAITRRTLRRLNGVAMTGANITGATVTISSGSALGVASAGTNIFVYGPAPSNTNLSPRSIGNTGGSLPHENRQPYLAVNFIIAWAGIFPSRN